MAPQRERISLSRLPPIVILRQWSRPRSGRLPTKDLSIPATSEIVILRQLSLRDYNIGGMLPSRKWRPLLSLLVFIGIVPHLFALIGEGRLYRGVLVQCLHGGPWVGQRYLGVYTLAQIYEEQVFTGTVQSVVETSFTERRLQITPDEVLLGNVSGEITATMSQACLRDSPPEIKAGDKWLFFVRTQYGDNAIPYYVVDFDSPAKPVALAQYEICLLRMRADIDESCIALMPAGRRVPTSFCSPRRVVPPLSTNLVPRSSPAPETEIELTRVLPPPEFRAYDVSRGYASEITLQHRGWHIACPSYEEVRSYP